MKKILLLFFTIIYGLNVNAQLSNKHWLPPLHANEDITDQNNSQLVLDHYIYLSTPEPTAFSVTVTDGNGTPISGSPFIISKGNPTSILIGNSQPSIMMVERNDVGHKISGKGLILEGEFDFYVSFRIRADSHAEFLASKGKTGAGTSFRLGSLPQNDLGTIRNFVSSFMATEDNTIVNLSDYDPDIAFINGNSTFSNPTQTFNLNKGQSVVISGNTSSGSPVANLKGFVGALLTSNKPIVVNTGNLAGGMDNPNEGQDFNLDQIVPWEQVGNEYVIMKCNGDNVTERPLVVAHEDNTQIFINGDSTPIVTLNAGEYFLVPTSYFQGSTSNLNMYLSGNKNFFLYQIVAGSMHHATNGFFFIPPLNCYWQKSVDMIPDINNIGSVLYTSDVILATEANSIVKINGIQTTASPVAVMGNPNWESYRINNLTGNVVVESTGPLAVGVFGSSGVAGFGGYFSGFGASPKDVAIDVCTGNIIDLFDKIPGNPELGGTWYFNSTTNPPRSNGGLFDPSVDVPGDYIYVFTKQCPGEPPLSIEIKVTVNNPIQQGPNIGVSTSKSYCVTDPAEDLTNLLGTNITPGGNWSFNGIPRNNGIIDPATDLSGIYKYTIPSNGVCDLVSATITVTINPSPQLLSINNYNLCDDSLSGSDNDGLAIFNLTSKNSEIFGAQGNVNVKYYESETDALNETTNNITSISASTGKIIYFRIENNLGCFQVGSFNLIVNPKPTIDSEIVLKQCSATNIANANFVLTQANAIININNEANLTFTYHTSQNGAINNTNLIVNDTNYPANNGSFVWARVETPFGCFRVSKVNLVVSTTQFPGSFNPQPLEECDYADTNSLENDGFATFDIENTFTNSIKSLFPANQQLDISYYESFIDAELVQNRIQNTTQYVNTTPNSQSIWARVDSMLNNDPGCKGIQELQLIVNPIPEVVLGENFFLCVDPNTGIGSKTISAMPVNSQLNDTFSYVWSTDIIGLDLTGEINATYDVTQPGTYYVLVTNTITGCFDTDSITATYSSPPATFHAKVTTIPFTNGLSTIVGIASGGYGIYEYSLDLINWQLDPQFNDIPNGVYTVYVRDIQGCGIKSDTNLIAITYPNFFTPNNDGYNDTWNISNLPEEYNAKISIFDRYGKLIKQISPDGNGWDGTYNGRLLPASDYWFTMEYSVNGEKKEFKSHFSLKR